MSGIVGVRQAAIFKKGTFVTPTEIIAFGLGDEASLNIAENTIKGYRDEDLPNEIAFNLKFKTYQPTIEKIINLILVHAVANGVDAQVVGERSGLTSGYTGVYDFNGANFLGIDFEIVQSMKSRFISIDAMASLPYENALTILQSAATNTPKDFSGTLGNKGENLAEYKHPFFGSAQSPLGTLFCNGEEIVDRTLSLKTESSKLQYDRSRINWIKVMLELTIDRNRCWQLVEYLSKDRNASIKLEEKDSASITQVWSFGAGVLYRKHEMPIAKDESHIKLTFEKKIAVYDFGYSIPTNTISVTNAV